MNDLTLDLNSRTQAAETIHFLGCLLTPRATASATGGSYSVIECRAAPGAGAPPHRQADIESFLVVEGTFEFMLDGEVKVCGPNGFIHVPAGAVHAFRNVAATPSRMYIFNMPGGPHEDFFRAVGEPVTPEQTTFPEMGPPDVPSLMAAAARFGIEILPPPAG